MEKEEKQNENTNTLRERVANDTVLSQESRDLLLDVIDGKALLPLTTDAMSKRVFSPDIHPDRFDFLMQRIMKDDTLFSDGSATNEPPADNEKSKKLIFDLVSWLRDQKYAVIEFQALAQEFIFKRADIYSSKMLVFQYSAEKGDKKSKTYENTKGVVLIILMKNSPKAFKDFDSDRYIHRITKATADTGIEFELLRKIAFVQLDKALEQFVNKTYNEDEDVELLKMLALIADANNETVYNEVKGDPFLKAIYEDVEEFSKDQEVQLMTFEQELDAYFHDLEIGAAEARGEERGVVLGEERITGLNAWLFSNNRDEDVKLAAQDKAHLEKLLKEYDKYIKSTQTVKV